jgi:hypothetical protein
MVSPEREVPMVTVPRNRTQLRLIGLMAAVLVVAACATETPLERLERQLEQYPQYSVTLQDMREDGYLHQYGVVIGEPQAGSEDLVYRDSIRDWQQVGRRTYIRYQPHLGMVILSKGPDGIDRNQHPPGYQQVGNQRYGQWRDEGGGRSFWVFYGQYALLSHMIGGFSRPIYRNDWNGYRSARGRGQTYYGAGGVYGTNGSVTRQTNPNFFRRQTARQAARSRSFGQRLSGRMSGGTRFGGK